MGGDACVLGREVREKTPLISIETGVAALRDATDLVASPDPHPWAEQLERYGSIVEASPVIDANVPNGVKPVVPVDEDDSSIRHGAQKEKPRRVACARLRGGQVSAPRGGPTSSRYDPGKLVSSSSSSRLTVLRAPAMAGPAQSVFVHDS